MWTVVVMLLGGAGVATGAGLVAVGLRQRGPDLSVLADDEGVADEELDQYTKALRKPLVPRLLAPIGAKLAGVATAGLPRNYRDLVRRRLLAAGRLAQITPDELITLQLVGLLVGGGLGALLGFGESGARLMVGTAALGGLVGFGLPYGWVRREQDNRADAIRKALPDTLDLLAISVEAGVGLEQAMEVAAERMSGPLATELRLTLREESLGLPRREALRALRERTDVPELAGVVTALIQAEAVGMPVGRTLTVQAGEMRTKRRQWAREKGAKLPVKILFPLALFILPSLFIVVLGPAAVEIARVFAD